MNPDAIEELLNIAVYTYVVVILTRMWCEAHPDKRLKYDRD